MRSAPNALVFEPGKGAPSVAVPKGSLKFFAPYGGMFTFVEDYDNPDRCGVGV